MRCAVAVLVPVGLFLAGCATRDPLEDTRGKLKTGEAAVVSLEAHAYHPDQSQGKSIRVSVAPGGGVAGSGHIPLAFGTKVRVVDDPDAESRPEDETREVRINVLEGEWAGQVGMIARDALRKVKE
jgi:hypothetical protein